MFESIGPAPAVSEEDRARFHRLKELYQKETLDFNQFNFQATQRIADLTAQIRELGAVLEVKNLKVPVLKAENEALNREVHVALTEKIKFQNETALENQALKDKMDARRTHDRFTLEEIRNEIEEGKEICQRAVAEEQAAFLAELAHYQDLKGRLQKRNEVLKEEIAKNEYLGLQWKINQTLKTEDAEDDAVAATRVAYERELAKIAQAQLEVESVTNNHGRVERENEESFRRRAEEFERKKEEKLRELFGVRTEISEKRLDISAKVLETDLAAMRAMLASHRVDEADKKQALFRAMLENIQRTKREKLEELSRQRESKMDAKNQSLATKKLRVAELQGMCTEAQIDLERARAENGKIAEKLIFNINKEILEVINQQ